MTRSLRARLFGIVGVAAVALAGCSAPITGETAEEDEAALVGNVPVDLVDNAVVGIVNKSSDGVLSICTGTLIAPRVVLTAAHCIVGVASSTVFVGPSVWKKRQEATVIQSVPHPSFKTSGVDRSDIGVLVLDKVLSPKPLALARTTSITEKSLGASVKMVGYGVTDPDGSGVGIKRSGNGTLAAIRLREVTVTGHKSGEIVACHGDSGGPAILKTAAGSSVFAVESRAMDENDCVGGSVKTRVDKYLPFIDAIVKKNAS